VIETVGEGVGAVGDEGASSQSNSDSSFDPFGLFDDLGVFDDDLNDLLDLPDLLDFVLHFVDFGAIAIIFTRGLTKLFCKEVGSTPGSTGDDLLLSRLGV
jgi:hypothetical protein